MQYDTEELHQTFLILFNTVFPQIVKMLQKMINIYEVRIWYMQQPKFSFKKLDFTIFPSPI